MLLALTLLLPGCVRYDESIVINADRSGSATLILERPDDPNAAALSSMFNEDQMNANLPAGVQLAWNTAAGNGRVTITAAYTFDDIRKLIAWAANKPSPLNNISITERSGELDFTRRIAPNPDPSTAQFMKDVAGDVSITFKLKGPGKLLETNAPRADSTTATWEFKAPELLASEGRTLTARFAAPHSSSTTLVAALAVLTAITMIALWIRSRTRRSRTRSA